VTGPLFFRDQHHGEWRGLFAPSFFIQSRDGEHLERAAKIKDLDVLEQHDADTLSVHDGSHLLPRAGTPPRRTFAAVISECFCWSLSLRPSPRSGRGSSFAQWNDVRISKPVPFEDLVDFDRNALREHGAVDNDGVDFAVLSGRIYFRRQFLQQIARPAPSREAGGQLLEINAADICFQARNEHLLDQFDGG
jgi:hypothetical protein